MATYFDTAATYTARVERNSLVALDILNFAAARLLTLGVVDTIPEGFRAAVELADTGRLAACPGLPAWIRMTGRELEDALLVCNDRELAVAAHHRNVADTDARLANLAALRKNARTDRRADRPGL